MKEWSLIKTEHRDGDYCMRCMRVLEAVYDYNDDLQKSAFQESLLRMAAREENVYLQRAIRLLEDECYLEEMEALWL